MDENYDKLLDGDSRSIRGADKLNYRVVIQDNIANYLKAIGTTGLEKAVKALRNSVYFDIPGLPFRSEITKKEIQLKREYVARVIALVKIDRDSWLHPIKKMLHNSTFTEKYYMDLAVFLLELIAEHDGLMQVKGMVEEGLDKDIDTKQPKTTKDNVKDLEP